MNALPLCIWESIGWDGDAAGCYLGLNEEKMPGSMRCALSPSTCASGPGKMDRNRRHTTKSMARNYQKGHGDGVWSEVEADLDIGKTPDGFARILRTVAHKKIQSPLSDWILWSFLVGTE